MDSYEATKTVFSRIQSLDPENASKIMGFLLLQDHGDKEMIRLAFGPETLLHNLIHLAKTQLGLSSNTPSTLSTPSSPSPFASRPNPLSISASSRPIAHNGSINNSFDLTNPSSPSSNSWPVFSPKSPSSLSYASIVNGTSNNSSISPSLSSTVSLSNAFPYQNGNSGTDCNSSSNDLIDEYQLPQDHFSFLNDSKNDELLDPRLELSMSPTAAYDDTHLHRRSFSVPSMCLGSEDGNSGLGWKPCMYFQRGFCKNGPTCRFLHGESTDGAAIVGSPSKLNEFEQCQELFRSKAAAAAASQFMAGASFPYSKCMNFLLQQQNETQRSAAAAAALMMGDELHKFGRCRPERNDFSPLGLGGALNPASRQIYLTFPADSTFREEDVSNYFSIYGPVQDVRIPFQQKRMFGFVTFVYPETVKLILAKGNPHFVCDSRVLVKPYKEKGKIPDKKQLHQQQQMERGEHGACPSPSGLDCREPFDLHLGAKMFFNSQEMLMRRKLEEQADLQQAIELQGRRLMNLQLLDIKSHNNNLHHRFVHGLSSGSPMSSPTLLHSPSNAPRIVLSDAIKQEVPADNGGKPEASVSENNAAADAGQDLKVACSGKNDASNGKKSNSDANDLDESLEGILPDNLFASPKKSAGNHQLTAFSTASEEADEDDTTSSTTTSSSNNSNPLMPTSSGLSVSSVKSCFLQMPRFASGHGTVGM